MIITAFFLQATSTPPVLPAAVSDFITEILRYLLGVGLVALAGACGKIWKDNLVLKKDVALLQQQRSADLIERDTVLAMAHTVKNETTTLKNEFDLKLKDIMHHFSEQQNKDRGMMKDMIHEVKLTLTELNTTIKGIQEINKK